MRILVRKNIRAISSNELLGPALEVTQIELVTYEPFAQSKHPRGEPIQFELYTLEDGSRKKAHELIFVEVDEDLLIAMRLEASILAGKNFHKSGKK